MSETGTVDVSDHQFLLTGSDTDTSDVTAEGTLDWTGPGFLTVLTGIAHGPATLTIETTTGEPDSAEWETVEEAVIDTATELLVAGIDGRVAGEFTPISPGRYRIRVHARGRDTDFDGTSTEPVEQYLVQLTTTTETPGSVVGIRKTDNAYTPAAKTLPEVDYEHFYAPGPDGTLTKVSIDSPAAQAVFASRGHWGGRPPSGRIADDLLLSSPASIIADLDRDLIDGIDVLPDEHLRALARWCARRAFDKAGLSNIADFRAALDAMDRATTPPAEFANLSLTNRRLETDPAIPLTIAPGIAGATDFVPQYEAARTYMFAVSDDLPAIKAALEAVRSGIATYGRDYPELISRLRTEFLPHKLA
ncbi:hypothetical protein [Nocardia aobensis]|uniref:hypothetical protein n=1 Tax=Nocardia aobensis TaxID=257277 RepID=UPI0002D9FEFD|nr:hypothetical protein [Nocardia aobensis]